jgi:hypothetical protein
LFVVTWTRDARFFSEQNTKTGKMNQMIPKYTKICHKICQLTTKYNK